MAVRESRQTFQHVAGQIDVTAPRSPLSGTRTPAPVSTPDLAAYGVQPGYRDGWGVDRDLPDTTATALAEHFAGHPMPVPALIATPGRFHPELVGDITYEDGTVVAVAGIVDRDGYHVLHSPSGSRRLVIAAPEYLPQPRRQWGFAV